MSKIKKVLAVVLAMAMVMAMSIVSFADSTATSSITVNNLTSDVTAVYVIPVALWNSSTNSWDVQTWVPEGAISFATSEPNSESVNWPAIKTAATAIADKSSYIATLSGTGTSRTATKSGLPLGVYTVIVDSTESSYNPMGDKLFAYNDNGEIIGRPVTINAKGAGYSVEKTLDDSEDRVVAIGSTVNFTITATFPSFADDETDNRVFTITDTPTGMDITNLVVSVGGEQLTENTHYEVISEAGNPARTIKFTSSYIDSPTQNAHATANVVVNVTAVINENVLTNGYSNSVETNYGSDEPVTGITGSIMVTKYNEKGATTEGKIEDNVLTGAEFEVYPVVDGVMSTTALQFVKTADGVYRLAKTTEAEGVVKVTTIVATNGTVTVNGLDDGTYHFKETKAPTGYAINENGVDVTLDGTGKTANFTVNGDLIDTKLSALPNTGGIGTTIFTVVGCLIMIAAAAMFFVSRRRTEK